MSLDIPELNFRDLFIFDLANNHQGSVEHGKKIIKEVGAVAKKHGVKAAFKFQFRQLDSFIHPEHINNLDNKHISRFSSTRLSNEDFKKLLDEVNNLGFYSMCTPFDEDSIEKIIEMNFDFIKVASCSAKDWPLLEKISDSCMPVVVSTGGLELKQVDNIVSFFEHKGRKIALMHCVSIYPIPRKEFYLSQIDTFKNRYPSLTIGWSTHESPEQSSPVIAAVAKGAEIFERHVGVETKEIKLNKYSSTPAQVDKWIESYLIAKDICGKENFRPIPKEEKASLDSLRRGIYLKKNIKKGDVLKSKDIFFAIPYHENQLSSGDWTSGIIAKKDYKSMEPCLTKDFKFPESPDWLILKTAIHEVKALLNKAKIVLNSDFDIEFSHHYGMKNFHKVGALIIGCINREYCKKIIVQLPGQKHPSHFHRRKEETFQVLYGVLETIVDGHRKTLHPGEMQLVQPGVWHSFWTDTGCVFEEVSSTHYNDDSVYNDRRINSLQRDQRKTVVDHWGRFQVIDKNKI
ncbi:N-acetylneuraminate synthase family protein [Prochlorococcus sp. MIT 1011]|uniref:N-acetylneuraminate synthase family protein n=1 Tax=Prochlorococcus sp. MIT 1011 TaxID=3082520 RepID=UPI0039B5D841